MQYGSILRSTKLLTHTLYTIQSESTGNTFIIESTGIKNKVELFRKGMLVLSYVDTINNDNTFTRTINNNKYIYNEDGSLILFYVEKPTKFMQSIKPLGENDNKIITLDIETKLDSNGEHKPYLISYYDGVAKSNCFCFFLSDYYSTGEMFKDCLLSLFVEKYNNYTIYVHNLAIGQGPIDGIFLTKELLETVTKVVPLIHKGRLISLLANSDVKGKTVVIKFLDSYQLLLAPLRKLAISFNTNTQAKPER